MTNETKTDENNKQKPYSDVNLNKKTGRLVWDAETLKEGAFVKFRIATNKQYETNEGEIRDLEPNFFDVMVRQAFTDAYNLAQKLKKGDRVYVMGNDGSTLIETSEGYKANAVVLYASKVELRNKKDAQAVADEKATENA